MVLDVDKHFETSNLRKVDVFLAFELLQEDGSPASSNQYCWAECCTASKRAGPLESKQNFIQYQPVSSDPNPGLEGVELWILRAAFVERFRPCRSPFSDADQGIPYMFNEKTWWSLLYNSCDLGMPDKIIVRFLQHRKSHLGPSVAITTAEIDGLRWEVDSKEPRLRKTGRKTKNMESVGEVDWLTPPPRSKESASAGSGPSTPSDPTQKKLLQTKLQVSGWQMSSWLYLVGRRLLRWISATHFVFLLMRTRTRASVKMMIFKIIKEMVRTLEKPIMLISI